MFRCLHYFLFFLQRRERTRKVEGDKKNFPSEMKNVTTGTKVKCFSVGWGSIYKSAMLTCPQRRIEWKPNFGHTPHYIAGHALMTCSSLTRASGHQLPLRWEKRTPGSIWGNDLCLAPSCHNSPSLLSFLSILSPPLSHSVAYSTPFHHSFLLFSPMLQDLILWIQPVWDLINAKLVTFSSFTEAGLQTFSGQLR